MKDKLVYIVAAIAGVLLVRNIYTILLVMPDELNQGTVYRIVYFHVPMLFTGLTGMLLAPMLSVAYLIRKDAWLDEMAASVVEVSWLYFWPAWHPAASGAAAHGASGGPGTRG